MLIAVPKDGIKINKKLCPATKLSKDSNHKNICKTEYVPNSIEVVKVT